jgi:hypothetical protein
MTKHVIRLSILAAMMFGLFSMQTKKPQPTGEHEPQYVTSQPPMERVERTGPRMTKDGVRILANDLGW